MMTIFLGILAVPLLCILRGFVLQQLWHWFVVAQFHVADMRIPVALGIAMLIGYVTSSIETKQEQHSFPMRLALGTAHALLTLGFGWVYHLFV